MPNIEHANLDWWVRAAYHDIETTHGDTVAYKGKRLFKFGANDSVGTSETTVMGLAGSETEETYVNTNAIDAVVSSSGSNTMEVTIEGHTISGSGTDIELTFVVQTATLNGQTPVALTTPLARATRVYNSSTTALAANSTIYVYDDTSGVTNGVPDTASNVHLIMEESKNSNTSFKAATAFSNVDYFLISQVYFGVEKKTTASVDFMLKIRPPGCLFRGVFSVPLDTAGNPSTWVDVRPLIVVPKNSDVILTAIASTTNVGVDGGFNGLICKTYNA